VPAVALSPSGPVWEMRGPARAQGRGRGRRRLLLPALLLCGTAARAQECTEETTRLRVLIEAVKEMSTDLLTAEGAVSGLQSRVDSLEGNSGGSGGSGGSSGGGGGSTNSADANGYELLDVDGLATTETDAVKIRATGFYLFDGSTVANEMPADTDGSLVLSVVDGTGTALVDSAVSVTGTATLSLGGGAITLTSTAEDLALVSHSTAGVTAQYGSGGLVLKDADQYQTLRVDGGSGTSVMSLRMTGFYLFDGGTSASAMPGASDPSLVLSITDSGATLSDSAVDIAGTESLTLSGGSAELTATVGSLSLESGPAAAATVQYGTSLTVKDPNGFQVLKLSGGAGSSTASVRADAVNLYRSSVGSTMPSVRVQRAPLGSPPSCRFATCW
jgi:hypothetical protein